MNTRVFKNAWVQRRGLDEISALAALLREKCGMKEDYNLNVVALLRKLQCTELPGKGVLNIYVTTEKPLGYIAYVSHEPLELHVEQITFERARFAGDFRSKYILSHEIGHIVLHNQLAVPFSNMDTEKNTTGCEEEQAEWQADRFADYLLAPDNIIAQFLSFEDAAKACGISSALSEKMFSRQKRNNRFKTVYLGEFCQHCQNPCLIRRGSLLECDNCGESYSAL